MKTTMIAALTLLLGCGRGDADGTGESAAGMNMTAEEHARMTAGVGTERDASGSVARQAIQLTPAQERALGVTYTVATRESLVRSVRTVGQILAAEPSIADVTPKIEGFVERLLVAATGTTVRRGEPLLELYSPMLVAAQEELLAARRLAREVTAAGGEPARRAEATLAAARRRLAYWDVTTEQIQRLENTGEVRKTLTLVSPVAGIVLEKEVVEGQQVMPGMRLYRIADLSEVWVEGEVFEQDVKFLRPGVQAHIEVAAYPGEHLMARVAFIYPTVDTESRTNRVRLSVANPDRRLKPGMFATLFFDAPLGGMLTVPTEAVIVTGERNLVFVRQGGSLVPRDVVLGARAEHRIQVLQGLGQGDTIVASANFLVDAESRLATTGSGMPGMQHGAVEPPSARPPVRPSDSTGHRHD